ncbi:MAG: NAD(P)/FAD-dependent oxidoreductase [Acetobacteraceae bacterium]|nr:NAD(P)/FAD-dependent oxidoreductase [Acetobacteraceae bacterium]
MADWDVVVVGGGAAGLAAAAACAEAGRRCLLIDRMGGGGELMNLATPLHDLPEETTGPDLAAALLERALAAGVELAIDEVTALAPADAGWRITTAEDGHGAPAVILAVGLAPGRLGVAGEAGFEGQGLSHCAACDGPLYRGGDVVMAGADRWAVQEALDLLPIAATVTLVTQRDTPVAAPGVTVIAGRVTGLEGDAGLDAVLVQAAGGAALRLPARAIFVQDGRRPALGFVPASLARDAAGRLVTDASLRCGAPGLYAVGEARAGFPSHLAAAAEDGRRVAAALPPLGKRPD